MKDLLLLPNQITILRILLIPVFVVFLFLENPYSDYIAAFFFIVLALSDAFDGYIARKKNQKSDLGKILDPISDKLLIAAALISLIDRIAVWMVAIILFREIAITLARLFLFKKSVIEASYLGKIKTVSQMVAIVMVILNLPLAWWAMLIAVITTVASGLDYIIKIQTLYDTKKS